MTALYFGWPAFRNRHFIIWGGGAGLGGGGGIIFIPAMHQGCTCPTLPQPPQSQSCDDSVTRSMVDNDLFRHSVDFLFFFRYCSLCMAYHCFYTICFCIFGRALCLRGVTLRSLFSPTVFVPHAQWEAYGRGSPPLHDLVSHSANPHCVSDPLPQSILGSSQNWTALNLDSERLSRVAYGEQDTPPHIELDQSVAQSALLCSIDFEQHGTT